MFPEGGDFPPGRQIASSSLLAQRLIP
jgi:hypothetical protein